MPTLYTILKEAVKCDPRTKRDRPGSVVTLASKVLFARSQQMNAVAKINGIRLRLAGVSKRIINLMNKTSDCVSYDTTTKLLDGYADSCTTIAKEWENESVVHAGDNVDVRSRRRHETSRGSTMDMHFYNNILFRSRVNFTLISDIPPTIPDKFSMDHYRNILPTSSDTDKLLNQLQSIVAEAWSSVDSDFEPLVITPNHAYTYEMSCTTSMIHLGVLEKNETKTADMVDILSYVQQFPSPQHSSMMAYFGDYATYERSKGAISIMANAEQEQISKLLPAISDFHLCMEWDQLIMTRLFKLDSMRDVGSLLQLKNLIAAKQVTPDVRKNYYASELFFNKITDALLRLGLEHMKNTTGQGDVASYLKMIFSSHLPDLPGLACSLCEKTFNSALRLKSHIEKHTSHSAASTSDQPDDHYSWHVKYLVKLLLIRKNLHVAIKYGDGERVLLMVKHMLPYFRLNNNYKYALACLELIAQTQIFLSPRQSVAIPQGRFVNMRGAPDSNYPIDLCVEHSNKVFKENIALYRGECTQRVLDRISKSQTMTKKILDNFQKEFTDKEVYVGHHAPNAEAYENDVLLLTNFLSPYDLYSSKDRKFTSSLAKHTTDPITEMNVFALQDWIGKRLNEMKTQSFLT